MKNSTAVLIFGLAGVGKSTLAQRLGAKLGWRVIHPSGLMRDLWENRSVDLNASRSNDGYWETPKGRRLLRERLTETTPLDVMVNEILLREVEKGGVVIDTWALPWLTDQGWRVHLTAPLRVRAARAATRRREVEEGSPLESLLADKDQETRDLFLRLYGFDIFRDHHVFDYTVDTTGLDSDQVFRRVLEGLFEPTNDEDC